MEVEASIAAARQVLEADPRVAAAILFGSTASDRNRRDSDLDVGIVARSSGDAAALDAELLTLGARASVVAERDVQLVLLDRVDPVLGTRAFRDGRKLFDRDPLRCARVLERILTEYFDGEHHRRMLEEALDRRLGSRHG